ncbi:hypothetical protein MGG_15709 [Pyricularia oryzae 70-15]|uniref:Uncharacterized protein n=1 Tax=Pyricularia oryzae (strain 70-15 / ATCC MYA-4617 / FGSC 8958) TaxID=242507 RepID=G4MSL4_PYRO7|nr:uncharacterized protein MGG_15709 [Pyricularia oryzae 70-15]EHA54630.1 hypothetical protein MGG_15709 [Pyricularia oryzae 70-15]
MLSTPYSDGKLDSMSDATRFNIVSNDKLLYHATSKQAPSAWKTGMFLDQFVWLWAHI